MREAEDAWRAGTASWVEWDKQAERARAAFGRIIGAPGSRVALMVQMQTGRVLPVREIVERAEPQTAALRRVTMR